MIAVAYLEKLNAEQRRAVEHGLADGSSASAGGPLLIIAGAGSGKTNTLAHRVAHLICPGRRSDALTADDLLPPRRRRDDAADERICAEALGANGGVSI